jgi:hypothetical protein
MNISRALMVFKFLIEMVDWYLFSCLRGFTLFMHLEQQNKRETAMMQY